jgi:hypothetical protein
MMAMIPGFDFITCTKILSDEVITFVLDEDCSVTITLIEYDFDVSKVYGLRMKYLGSADIDCPVFTTTRPLYRIQLYLKLLTETFLIHAGRVAFAKKLVDFQRYKVVIPSILTWGVFIPLLATVTVADAADDF